MFKLNGPLYALTVAAATGCAPEKGPLVCDESNIMPSQGDFSYIQDYNIPPAVVEATLEYRGNHYALLNETINIEDPANTTVLNEGDYTLVAGTRNNAGDLTNIAGIPSPSEIADLKDQGFTGATVITAIADTNNELMCVLGGNFQYFTTFQEGDTTSTTLKSEGYQDHHTILTDQEEL